ncbi:MAG: polyhydroxyalkanoate synthesis regulator DNA-binding domain-containing protein [Myxococcota bacterium]
MRQRGKEVLIKKYSNRRLYDTAESRYITLEELGDTIRRGADVRVVDAKSNDDLTQVTLTQLILESRRAARLLPIPLLTQLIRMNDDALAEFFGRYMTWALDFYQHAKAGASALAPFNPFATLPFAATSALARFMSNGMPWQANDAAAWAGAPPPPPPSSNAPAAPAEDEPQTEDELPAVEDEAPHAAPHHGAGHVAQANDAARHDKQNGQGSAELASLKREIEELKRAILRRE